MKSLTAIIATICVIFVNEAASTHHKSSYPYEFLPIESIEDFYVSPKRNKEIGEAVEQHRRENKQNERAVTQKYQPLCKEERLSLRIGAPDKAYEYRPYVIDVIKCVNETQPRDPKEPHGYLCGVGNCMSRTVDRDIFRRKRTSHSCWEHVTTIPVPMACECEAKEAVYESRPKKPYYFRERAMNIEDFSENDRLN